MLRKNSIYFFFCCCGQCTATASKNMFHFGNLVLFFTTAFKWHVTYHCIFVAFITKKTNVWAVIICDSCKMVQITSDSWDIEFISIAIRYIVDVPFAGIPNINERIRCEKKMALHLRIAVWRAQNDVHGIECSLFMLSFQFTNDWLCLGIVIGMVVKMALWNSV